MHLPSKVGGRRRQDCCWVEVNLATLTFWGYYRILSIFVSIPLLNNNNNNNKDNNTSQAFCQQITAKQRSVFYYYQVLQVVKEALVVGVAAIDKTFLILHHFHLVLHTLQTG